MTTDPGEILAEYHARVMADLEHAARGRRHVGRYVLPMLEIVLRGHLNARGQPTGLTISLEREVEELEKILDAGVSSREAARSAIEAIRGAIDRV